MTKRNSAPMRWAALGASAFAACLLAVPVAEAASLGRWSGVIPWPRIPIHAMIMPDGRLLTYGSPAGDYQSGLEFDLWDPKRGIGADSHLTLANNLNFDSFCAGLMLQPWDGVAMTAGGVSLTGTALYDSQSLKTRTVGSMRYPRWYATLTTMPDGRIAIQGGMTIVGWDTHSIVPELYTPGQGWAELPGAANADAYGRLAADGRANYVHAWPVSGSKLFTIAGQAMFYLDVAGQGSISGLQPFNRSNWGATSTAVMYQPGRILQAGGGSPYNNAVTTEGSRAATLIDITGSAPVVTETEPMAFPRHWGTATVLPNGEVLMTGGSAGDNDGRGPAYVAEIWNPRTGTWRQDARQAKMRLYHSVAILLPDGRVLSGGGGIPGPETNRDVEIYTPGYLLDDAGNPAPRPAITAAPGLLTLGQSFQVSATGSGGISRVTLVKAGAVTHSMNFDQRFIELGFRANGNTLSVDAPANTVVATPGYYMLFVLDGRGVPSEGRMVKVPVPTGADDRIAPGSRLSNSWTAAVGTTRGGLWNIRCEDGEVMAGLYGTADAGIGGVGARCVTAAGGRWTANPRSFGAGLDGRPPFTRDCPRDQAITAIGGQASEQATQLVVTCSPMNAANGSAGGGAKLAAVGNGGGNAAADSPCPEGGSAYGLFGEGNANGNRIGLLCRNGTVAAANAPPSTGSGIPPLPTNAVSLESASTPGYYARPVDANLTVAAAQATSAADKAAAAYTLIPGLSGSGVSFRSVAKPAEHLMHAWFTIYQRGETAGGTFKADASFTRRAALAPSCGCASGACLSYESVSWPGYFIRNRGGQLGIDPRQDSADFIQSASFCERAALGGEGGASLTGPLSLQSSADRAQYVTSTDAGVRLTAPATRADRNRATYRKVAGLNGSGVSFESALNPGQYLRHAAFQIWQGPNDGGAIFKAGATFTPLPALAGACSCSGSCQSYESVDWRGHYLRRENGGVFMRQNDGTVAFRQDASFCEAPPLSETPGATPASPPASAPAASWTACAPEGGTCSVTGTQTVRYGAKGQYATRTVNGSVGCNNGVFGDPIYGTVKSCEVMTATAAAR
ncbi:hypothetical protein J2X36_003384 [Methylobacterium sp. BE186]|uniref:AbfB domain-containing protein n=1 Tax=Methylobacterium sp. BE186 TaxID=2817715 RepID=UPI00285A468A|nr:AbfB domain-containing protein [Methylobacterium sp. BE186]MDR7038614.1 hypothetical protein [Methylobacterium sp. BE186]